MANVAARLRKILKIQKSTPLSKPSAITTANPPHPLSIKELANISDPQELATKFKQRATESLNFRNRHNIYDFTIGRLANSNRFSLIEDILESHKYFHEITHEGFSVRLISLYGKAGMFDHARKLFDEMPQLNCPRTIMSLNALMKAGVDSKRFDDVCKVFREFPSELSIGLNCVSYNTYVHCLCEMGLLDEAFFMLHEMKMNGISPNVITFNTLLDGFYRGKGFEGGENIWELMVDYNILCNTRSYNLRMQAMVNAGELCEALDLFNALEGKGLKPDVNTFNVLIKAYIGQGDIGEAKRWYTLLLDNGNRPNGTTFDILISRLCDVGDYDLAYVLCKHMYNRQFVVDAALLQLVVDSLVKGSMIEEAKEIVDQGKSNAYVQYNLALPVDSFTDIEGASHTST